MNKPARKNTKKNSICQETLDNIFIYVNLLVTNIVQRIFDKCNHINYDSWI